MRRTQDAAVTDAFTNALARIGWGTPSLLEATDYPLTRLTRNYVLLQSLYRSHWIVRQVIDAIPEDMVKNWVELVSQVTPEQIDDFSRVIDRTQTKNKILIGMKWGRLFGGAGAVIIIKGHENILDKPLNLDDVDLDAYKGLLVFDRWSGITPNAQLITDLDDTVDFGLPESYRVTTSEGQSFNVHASRVLRFCGRDLPQWEWQAEWRWGLSEIEAIYDELRKRDNTSWSIANLMFRANIINLKMKDVTQLLALGTTAQQQRLQNVLTAQNQLMNNQGMLVTDAEPDAGMETHAYSFGGVSDVYETFMMDISGACGIPVSRLYGRTISGLSQSNEGDERIYYDSIDQKRESKLRPQLMKLLPVVAMSTWGEVPDDLDFKFRPLHVPSDKERADLTQQYSTAVVATFNAGLISQQIGLKELRQQSDVTGMFSNITDEDIEKADDSLEPKMDEPVPGESEPGEAKGAKTADAAAVARRSFRGIPVSIEYPSGTRRTIRNDAGDVVYDRLMLFAYGFIEGTIGRDGDEIDVILGPDESSERVFVFDMIDLGVDVEKREDEDKVLLGFATEEDAREAFLTMYPPEFIGGIQAMSIAHFRNRWLGKK